MTECVTASIMGFMRFCKKNCWLWDKNLIQWGFMAYLTHLRGQWWEQKVENNDQENVRDLSGKHNTSQTNEKTSFHKENKPQSDETSTFSSSEGPFLFSFYVSVFYCPSSKRQTTEDASADALFIWESWLNTYKRPTLDSDRLNGLVCLHQRSSSRNISRTVTPPSTSSSISAGASRVQLIKAHLWLSLLA